MRHLIRTSDFTKEEILKIFDDAREFKNNKFSKLLEGKIIVTLFLKTQQEQEALLK